MPSAPPNLDPATTPEVQELARAMREGLELRRFQQLRAAPPLPPLPEIRGWLAPMTEVVPADARGQLYPLASLSGHPAPAPPGKIRRFVRLVRRLMKKLFNPWLEVQTRFNHGTIEALEASARSLHAQTLFNRAAVEALEASRQAVQQHLRELHEYVRASVQTLAAHVNDFAHRLRDDCAEHERRVGLALAALGERLGRDVSAGGV
jgi:hypothetical protein